jgi:hypothetical protein
MRLAWVAGAVLAWFALLARSIIELYRRGLSMLWIAPFVLALIVLPEFLQHVTEIQLGMFDSRAEALAAGEHPLRWAFGYAKLAGLVLTFLATARFWWVRENGGTWWYLRTVAWGRFLLGLLLFGGLPQLAELTEPLVGTTTKDVITWLVAIAALPFALLMLSGLFGDRRPALKQMWTSGWPALLILCVLLPLAFAPAQILHGYNHAWAFGQNRAIVWALMTFDSLVVGLLAGLTGTALYVGYAAFARRHTAEYAAYGVPVGGHRPPCPGRRDDRSYRQTGRGQGGRDRGRDQPHPRRRLKPRP